MSEQANTNYPTDVVEEMVATYNDEPTRATVELLAKEFGKTTRSIIAKLSREGVYVAQTKAPAAGAVVRKEDIVADIEAVFGIKVPSLVKASKLDLEALLLSVSQFDKTFPDMGTELDKLTSGLEVN
jgi:hypothetical protein|tara:strand:+ start:75 stop:455 length:381 start_codon:yes stop_codon:yes gene_type:complete